MNAHNAIHVALFVLPLVSAWSALATYTQLSAALRTPSLSMSGSQKSPVLSESVSVCWAFGTSGQLSLKSGMPSPSLELNKFDFNHMLYTNILVTYNVLGMKLILMLIKIYI